MGALDWEAGTLTAGGAPMPSRLDPSVITGIAVEGVLVFYPEALPLHAPPHQPRRQEARW